MVKHELCLLKVIQLLVMQQARCKASRFMTNLFLFGVKFCDKPMRIQYTKTRSECVKTEDEKKNRIENEWLNICWKLVLELMVQVQLLRIVVDPPCSFRPGKIWRKILIQLQTTCCTTRIPHMPDAAIAFPTIPCLLKKLE